MFTKMIIIPILFATFVVITSAEIKEFYTFAMNKVDMVYGIPYGKLDDVLREGELKSINDSDTIDIQRKFYLQGGPDCPHDLDWGREKEEKDCLFLNVYAPGTTANKTLPVVVWILGGWFNDGHMIEKSLLATKLAKNTNSVVVTVQYRIGLNGFFYSNNEYAPGNNGLKDQVLALKWVQSNINYFHGDKNNVILIGKDAGAASVGYHLLSPKTSKLFKSAVMIDGSPLAEWAFLDNQEAFERSRKIAEKLKCDERLKCLKKGFANPYYSEDLPAGSVLLSYYLPTQESQIVTDKPIEMLHKAHHLQGKKIIIGTSTAAGRSFAEKAFVESGCNNHKLAMCYYKNFQDALMPLLNDNATVFQMFHTQYKSDGKYYIDKMSNVLTDRYFKCPSDEFAKIARKHGATVYQFESDEDDDLRDIMKFFMFGEDDKETYENEIYSKTGFQLAGFINNGNPSSIKNKGWDSKDVFHIGHEQGVASERSDSCQFLKAYLPKYLEQMENAQESLKATYFIFFCTIAVLIRNFFPNLV